MSPELIGIIGVGLMMAGLVFTLYTRQDRRMDRMEIRMDRMEERMNQRMDRMEEQMNQRFDRMEEQNTQRFNRMEEQNTQRFDAMGTRLGGLEQGQSYLAGEMSTLREAILLRAAIQS